MKKRKEKERVGEREETGRETRGTRIVAMPSVKFYRILCTEYHIKNEINKL